MTRLLGGTPNSPHCSSWTHRLSSQGSYALSLCLCCPSPCSATPPRPQLLILDPVTDKFTESVYVLANEPSVALYRLQEHVRRSLPELAQHKVSPTCPCPCPPPESSPHELGPAMWSRGCWGRSQGRDTGKEARGH